MQLYKRGGIWHYSFTIDKKRYRGSTKCYKKPDARRVMSAKYDEAIGRDLLGEKPSISLADAMRAVVQEMDSPKTRASYDLSFRKWLGLGDFDDRWHLPESMKLHELTQQNLDDHLRNRKREGLRPNSITLEVRFMQKVYNVHRKSYLVTPELEFVKPKPFVKRRFISAQEEKEIVAILLAPGERGKRSREKAFNLFLFLLHTGVRLSEALTTSWQDLDLSAHRLTIYRSKTASISPVPLSDTLTGNLRLRQSDPAPFMHMDYAIKVLRRVIHEVCNQDVDLCEDRGRATIHSLRDTFVTRLERRGMSLRQIGIIVGHSSMETTKKYAHTQSDCLIDEARRLIDWTK